MLRALTLFQKNSGLSETALSEGLFPCEWMFVGLICTPNLEFSDSSHQVNFSTEIILMITGTQEYYLISKPLKVLLSFHNPGFYLYFSECIVLLIPIVSNAL